MSIDYIAASVSFSHISTKLFEIQEFSYVNIKKVKACTGLQASSFREMISKKISKLCGHGLGGGNKTEERNSQQKALIIQFQSNTWLIFALLIKVI